MTNPKLEARNILEQTPFAERVATYRAAYQERRAKPRTQRHLLRGDWVRFVLSVNRVCQIEAFAEVEENFSDEVYWRLLGHVLWNAENTCIYRELYRFLMRSRRPHHLLFMTPAQLAGWKALPERVLIFRGHGGHNRDGFWYSLNAGVALDVASSYGAAMQVSPAIVSKHDLFFLGGKGESVVLRHRLG